MIEFVEDGPVSVEDEVMDQLEDDADGPAGEWSTPKDDSVKGWDLL
jgi:hypothetical protein